MAPLKRLAQLIERQIVDDEYRTHITTIALSILFTLVAIVMCVVNIVTKQYSLLMSVAIFGVVSLGLSIVNIFLPKTQKVCEIIFVIDVIFLFSFFLLSGGVDANVTYDPEVGIEGFSTYWILLLPILGMLAFGFVKGSILSAIMFVILILFLWTPLGDMIRSLEIFKNITYSPTPAFKTRFNLVYMAAYFAGALLELIRYFTAKKLLTISNLYKNSANTDSLTQLNNQTYVANYMKSIKSHVKVGDKFGCFFIDIDNFKNFNEEYNHLVGNEVLKAVASVFRITDEADLVARWGGDEFIMFFIGYNADQLYEIGEKVRARVEALRFNDYPDIRITISIGIKYETITKIFNIDNIIYKADSRLAIAKSEGKNKVIFKN
ncbi:MAG: GGDEF domain-containing protein [Bacilli bacterium]|nr:GGDEF domain-containing protein [Bacilli bacterium]